MKIGILTYHFARNYGAILQCYALQTLIERQGHDVEILNFFSAKQERNNSLHKKRDSLIANAAVNAMLLPFEVDRRRKEKKYREFEKRFLHRSKILHVDSELREYVNSNHFDYIVIGGDQVFNPNVSDFDPIYFLSGAVKAKRVAFSASLGGAELGDLELYVQNLEAFDAVYLRESASVEFADRFSTTKLGQVCDPVFALDAHDWNLVLSNSGYCGSFKSGSYVLGYFLNKGHMAEMNAYAKEVAKDLKLPLLLINARYGLHSFGKHVINDAGPLDFIYLFQNASCVLTDSFHGTAFSIINAKSFASFETTYPKLDFRKRDLLSMLGIENSLVSLDGSNRIESIYDALLNQDADSKIRLQKIREQQTLLMQQLLV